MAVKTGTQFAKIALSYQGTPYVWGGASPKGFDCSGLVYYVLTKMGIPAPRTSEQQYAWAKPIGAKNLKPGDLVFLNFPGEVSPGHVMIWLGGNKVLQAPKPGANVEISGFSPQAPGTSEWGGTIVGYGRPPGLSFAGENTSDSVASPHGGGIVSDIKSAGGTIIDNTIGGGVPITGAVSGAVGSVESVYGTFKSAADVFGFIFSIRGLQTIGGGILLLMGLYLLVRQVGLAADVPTPPPIKDLATAAVPAARASREAKSMGVGPSERRPRTVHHYHPVGSEGERRMERRTRRERLTYDPATTEIPF